MCCPPPHPALFVSSTPVHSRHTAWELKVQILRHKVLASEPGPAEYRFQNLERDQGSSLVETLVSSGLIHFSVEAYIRYGTEFKESAYHSINDT